jgi:hypothetical protein
MPVKGCCKGYLSVVKKELSGSFLYPAAGETERITQSIKVCLQRIISYKLFSLNKREGCMDIQPR